jgi:hypothetical protein
MKSSICTLLLTATLAASCARRAAWPFPTPSEPPALLPAGWQELEARTVCLEVQQSFQETADTFSLPVEPLVRQTLSGLRLGVVPAGQACDVNLLVQLTGKPLAKDYQCILGSECGRCYTGAKIGGEVRLTRSDRVPLSLALDESIEGPFSISHCPKKPEQAPFDDLWPRAVLGALLDLWGPGVLVAAYGKGQDSVRLGAVELGYRAGMASLPLLTFALGDRSTSIRGSAASCLQYLGEGAGDAVPGLIGLLHDEDYRARSNAANALHAITGQDFGEDQARWRSWLAEGKPTPTPWTSWEGVVMMPGARWANQSGTMRAFTVDVSCEEAMAFYRAQAPPTGRALTSPTGPTEIWVARGAGAVQLYFHDAPVSPEQPRCSVQFWLE